MEVAAPSQPVARLKLDIGCGMRPLAGFEGVDVLPFGQTHHVDVRVTPWPWSDGTVGEVHSSHFLEHLDRTEMVPFFNELYRVLAMGGKATIITPNWSHGCAYGDPTHKTFLSSWYAFYLNRAWRDINAPHVPYACNFDFAISGSWDERLNVRSQEFKMFAMDNYINNTRDLIVALTKIPMDVAPPPPAA